ncbi:hypothetical protein BV372_19560 [Nostoc sp. T09]|uniref:hypothetical protein n=1 Tax=Nostoc sp. T09 TaxID=1932621 RepID=UPI000A3A492D|nr:hypothetical protein [Nostoc sp. T09]OUL32232.1 hypothetical protein BV372_19560 [Nostoc sp. T09]
MRFDELEKERQRNRCLAQEKFSEIISAIQKCIDTQHKYVELFYGFLGKRHLTQHRDAETPIVSAVVKNEIALYSSFILTIDGLYGSGLAQLRSVYEALMIAKFASLGQSNNFISKWIAGETIYFSNAILKKIVAPEMKEMRVLWKTLCQVSHATIYSYQVVTRFEEIENKVSGNLGILVMLLACNLHLINKHYVTNSMVYLAKTYHSHEGEFQRRRDAAKNAVQVATTFLSVQGRQVVREYSRVWQLASSITSSHNRAADS